MNIMGQLKKKWDKIPITAKAAAVYTICSIVQKCISIITLPLFTRLLSTEQYGQVTVYSSWSSLLVILLTLQLPYGSFSTAMVKFEDRRDEYIASVEGICLLLSAAFLIVYLPFRIQWNKLFELPTFIMVFMVCDILAGTGIAFWSGKKRFELRYKEVVAVTIAVSVLSPVVQLILVHYFEEKGYARIIGGVLVKALIGGVIYIVSIIRGKKLYDKTFWKYAFGFNIPLLAYYLSQMIFNASDKLMISHMVGKDKAAIYGVAYNLAIMFNFLLTSINSSYVPWFYGRLKEKKQNENVPIANAIALLMSGVLLMVIWFAPEIINIMAGDKYQDAQWIVPPVAMSVLLLFYSQLSINIEFYFEEKKMLVNASIAAALVNVVLNYLLIPILGYYVAGYTTLLSYFLFAIANYFAMGKVLKQKNFKGNGLNVITLSVILVIFILAGFMGMAAYGLFAVRLLLAAVLTGIVMLYRNRLLRYWKIIKKK